MPRSARLFSLALSALLVGGMVAVAPSAVAETAAPLNSSIEPAPHDRPPVKTPAGPKVHGRRRVERRVRDRRPAQLVH